MIMTVDISNSNVVFAVMEDAKVLSSVRVLSDRQRPAVLAALAEGKSVAYASDAGTPLVADPGYRLARDAAEAGFVVRALPGPSAALTAARLQAMLDLPTPPF